MHETLALTRLLNHLFAGPVDSLLYAIGVHPANPAAPIKDAFALELLIAALLLLFFVVVRVTLSVETPGVPQQFAELMHEFIGGQADSIIGHNYSRFQSFVTIIFVFILSCNLIGLIPGINSPTELEAVTLALATATFIYYNYYGIKDQGLVNYIKHFAGPVWWLAPLIFPIEIVSHFARIMSLSVRLYANMFAGGLVTLVFFSLVPIGVPVVFLGLHLLVSVVQAFVFTLLVMIYLSIATADEH
jgi:F-type H+-transporting ATPase subunit a